MADFLSFAGSADADPGEVITRGTELINGLLEFKQNMDSMRDYCDTQRIPMDRQEETFESFDMHSDLWQKELTDVLLAAAAK